MPVFLYIAAGVLLAAGITLRITTRGFPWLHFYIKGKESGFNFHEINLLRRVAVENRLQNPTSLFWSIRQLDRSIRGVILNLRAQETDEDERSVHFISKLFEFRKRVEFNLPKYRLGLKSTRNIVPNQKIKLTFPGGGVYHSNVIENMKKYLAISYPSGPVLSPGVQWRGEKINVYFWRAEDAGYYFETRVLGDFIRQSYPILHLAHSSQLVRTQKRRSHRRDVNKPALLHVLKTITKSDEIWEVKPGLRCRVLNISESGAAVLVGGRAKPGIPVKIQFWLLGAKVVMCGVVKGVSYDHKKAQSVLHIEAVTPSPGMKNLILMYVYGIFAESSVQNREKNAHIMNVNK